MFRLTLKSFRCWENLTFTAKIGSVTLIRGSSGCGKTTMFQAIIWCLYGQITKITPIHLEKAKTQVVIEMPFTINGVNDVLRIDRQKDPRRLIVQHGNSVYEDKVAQALINDLFGNDDIWTASCYIGQGCRNTFLTAPNAGKMELLNSIAFHEEDPSQYIERIDAVLAETESTYKTQMEVFNNLLSALQPMMNNVDMSKALTKDVIDAYQQYLVILAQEISAFQKAKQQRDVDLQMLSYWNNSLSTLSAKIITLPTPDDNLKSNTRRLIGSIDFNDYKIVEYISTLQGYLPFLQRRDDLLREMNSLKQTLTSFAVSTVDYTADQLAQCLTTENKYAENSRLAQSLSIPYTSEAIDRRITELIEILASQGRLRLENELNTLRQRSQQLSSTAVLPILELVEISSVTVPVPDYTKYSTVDLLKKLDELNNQYGAAQVQLQQLQRGRDVLRCPHCRGSVRYQQGQVISAETGPTSNDEILAAQKSLADIVSSINTLRNEIQQLQTAEITTRQNYERAIIAEQQRVERLKEQNRQIELENSRRQMQNNQRESDINNLKLSIDEVTVKLSAMPDSPNKRLLSEVEISQVHQLIARLKTVVIVELPPVSSEIINKSMKYQQLQQKLVSVETEYRNCVESNTKLVNESTNNIRLIIDSLTKFHQELKSSTEEIIRIEKQKQELKTQIETISAKILDDPILEIDLRTTKINELKSALTINEKIQQVFDLHRKTTEHQTDVLTLNTEIAEIQTLRQQAVNIESKILQGVVDSINSSIQDVCNTLFDNDILIQLSMFKTLKTTKNVKPTINFTVAYKGGNFDNINSLSGGEGDRASIALTLALNRLSSCPILVLDEPLAALDLNTKDAVIRTIRKHTDKTVLLIMHDGIEGVFDDVFDVENAK